MDRLYYKLKRLMQQGDMEILVDILQNAPPSYLINGFGMTLIHLAAQQGNVQLLEFFLELQFNVNVQDSSGATPIVIAARNHNFKIVEILLNNFADIFIADSAGLTLLDILVYNKINVPTNTFEITFERLKTSGMEIENIVAMLVKSKCSLDLVLLMKEPKVTGALLDTRQSMGAVESCALVNRAIGLDDMDNLAVLLLHGPGQNYRQDVFLKFVCQQLMDANADLNFLKVLLNHLYKWNFVNVLFVSTLRLVFQNSNEDIVRLLLDCGFDKYVKTKLGFDLIADMFVNSNFKAFDLLKNREFDANAKSEDGASALELAVRESLEDNVKFLLDVGADPNQKANVSLLTLAKTEKVIYLLLHYGVDLIDTSTMFPVTVIVEILRKVALAKCAYNGHLGLYRYPYKDKPYYENCGEQMEWTREQIVRDNLRIYDILSASVRYLSRFVKDEDTVSKILDTCREKQLDRFYLFELENNLNNALLMNKCKFRIADLLSQIMQINSNHLVVEKIVGYLEFKHLLALS